MSDEDSNAITTWRDEYRAILARGHRLAEQLGARDYFNALANRDDDSLMHRLNRMGEALINLVLTNLDPVDVQEYMAGRGLKARVYLLDTSGHRERLVHSKSPYMERLHLACERGFPEDWGQFLYAIARVRNEYSHKLELMDQRILDVIAVSFPEETGINLIDALMLELHYAMGGFAFEPPEPDRSACGHYRGFRNQHVVRRLAYTPRELIAKRATLTLRWQDDEEAGGIDAELKAAIIQGMHKLVSTFAMAVGTKL